MRYAASLLLFALWLPAQTPTGAIHGVVKEAATGAPLQEFNISLGGGNTDSDEQGRFAFDSVAPGVVTLTARHVNRETVIKKVVVAAGYDVAVEIRVPPNAMLSGRVLDSAKKPAAGIKVWAVPSDSPNGMRLIGPRITGDDGHYAFEFGLTAGRKFYLLADLPSPESPDPGQPIEVATYFGNAITLDAATPIVLEPQENRTGQDIQIRKSAHFCVSGAITVAGQPASVPFEIREAALAGATPIRASGCSGADGKFHTCGLTPDEYRLTAGDGKTIAGAVDFAVTDADVSQVDLFLDSVPLHLTVEWVGDPAPVPPPVILRLVPAPGGANQWIADASGGEPSAVQTSVPQPEATGHTITIPRAPRVMLSLRGVDNGASRTAAVNPPFDGPFDSGIVPTGDYRVSVNPSDCCYVQEIEYSGVRLDGPLHLGAGSSGTLRVRLASDGAQFRGDAVDDDGNPLPDASIVLVPEGQDPLLHWNMLAPGKYRVLAVNRAVALPQDLEKVRGAISNVQSIELAPKAKLELKLHALSID